MKNMAILGQKTGFLGQEAKLKCQGKQHFDFLRVQVAAIKNRESCSLYGLVE